MRIINSIWKPQGNALLIECICGNVFHHRADRWNVRCPACDKYENLQVLRDEYVKRKTHEKKQ